VRKNPEFNEKVCTQSYTTNDIDETVWSIKENAVKVLTSGASLLLTAGEVVLVWLIARFPYLAGTRLEVWTVALRVYGTILGQPWRSTRSLT
jgi:hypothetical protein